MPTRRPGETTRKRPKKSRSHSPKTRSGGSPATRKLASPHRVEREDALDNLDEAIAGYHGEGNAPTDEELREMGIDPENNESGSIEDSEIFE